MLAQEEEKIDICKEKNQGHLPFITAVHGLFLALTRIVS